MASQAYKTARHALGELQRLLQSDERNTMSHNELESVLTELQIMTREVSMLLTTGSGGTSSAGRATSAPHQPVGMLSRLVDAWSQDLNRFQSSAVPRWDRNKEREKEQDAES